MSAPKGHRSHTGPCVPWSADEDAYLVAHYASQTIPETAAALKRPYDSVRGRGRRLGLTKPAPPRIAWVGERVRLLRLYGAVPTDELARRIGCSVASLHQAARTHTLPAAEGPFRALEDAQRQIDADQADIRRLGILLACARSLIGPMDVAEALGIQAGDVPKLLTRAAMAGAQQIQQRGERAS